MFVLRVAAIALTLLSAPAHALFVTYSSDNHFDQGAGFTKAFGANARWGNNATNGDWEYSVVNASDIPLAQRQLQWTGLSTYPNHEYDFSYSGGTATLTLRPVDGTNLPPSTATVATPPGGINVLAVRAKADSGDIATVRPFVVNFSSGGSVAFAQVIGDGDAEYRMLVDSRLADGFWISDGSVNLQNGRGSAPMWQFKVGVSPIPVPAALPLMAVGLVVLGFVGRRARP